MNSEDEIRSLLQSFQDGYTHRDISQSILSWRLFTADAEVIGTNGLRPGEDEWYMDRASARELVEGDWQGWGDLRLDLDSMSIHQPRRCGLGSRVCHSDTNDRRRELRLLFGVCQKVPRRLQTQC